MKRRKSLKIMALGALTPGTGILSPLTETVRLVDKTTSLHFESDWHKWPDMDWVGPEYWGNRLQDWKIKDGNAICQVNASNRTLHCLTTQVKSGKGTLKTSVDIKLAQDLPPADDNYIGIRLGVKGKFDDYRSAAVHGKGTDIAITTSGKLKIKDEFFAINKNLLSDWITLQIEVTDGTKSKVTLTSKGNAQEVALPEKTISPANVAGNIALVSSIKDTGNEADFSADFSNWKMTGSKLTSSSAHEYGPICFAQYTLHKGILKLTGQLAPVEQVQGHVVSLQLKMDGHWKDVGTSPIDPLSRTVHFRHEQWHHKTAIPYRITLMLPLKDHQQEYHYEGSITPLPKEQQQVKAAVFSCNCDYGFPDSEVPEYVDHHHPDLAFFVGDQFYESTGGFGIQKSPVDKAALDYLRKWMMFGWSYRDIYRHIPCAIIPDDHDVYHGNIWGEAGKAADISKGWGAPAQDSGGYKMEPRWVNMVQKCQTSHLPDPYDATPVQHGIEVYYTDWVFGGISFAILEDRKWKSAPKHVLPEEADIWNGWIRNPDFDIKKHRVKDAKLLGDRQLTFLDHWAGDWSGEVQMKALVSQTIFNTVSTLPAEAVDDSVVPKMEIPQLGEYVTGDKINGDMDSNGWPQVGRDKAIEKIRKCFAFHIAGDQHLASFTQYGVDEYGDSGFAFAGPALNNIWPRRWWPPVANPQEYSLDNPLYNGNHEDGFGNKMTVKAVANPRKTGREPAIVYDRATGYGIVTFDKKARTITTECWPKYVNPSQYPDGQYAGWPITVRQEDNYGKKAVAWLPEVKVNGMTNPILEVIDEATGESAYSISLRGNTFTPKVFKKGTFTVRVIDGDTGNTREKKGIKATSIPKGTLMLS
ncbi:twin-arginine translocation pathway signal protein [Echinicola strongylocentroti]|uniref:Twin-arginine translocation pathway signal protein n=1 Tax=Echinicola strongylocentroti TaxID=1795355 RepID=A0A2Z4INR7_9BACT|nr:twin-arginine translocation pathway signal protein [Echinicola strongylocentroti]AWW32400.1 twin-arginine translocation pathway signal protein [Echinicola strongylocentroti]